MMVVARMTVMINGGGGDDDDVVWLLHGDIVILFPEGTIDTITNMMIIPLSSSNFPQLILLLLLLPPLTMGNELAKKYDMPKVHTGSGGHECLWKIYPATSKNTNEPVRKRSSISSSISSSAVEYLRW